MLSSGIPIRSKDAILGDVFAYILSDEWGISPEPSIESEMLTEADHNVYYREANETEKSDQSQINGGLDCGNPAAG